MKQALVNQWIRFLKSNNDLVASVITNLSSEDNTFLTTSNSEANNAIKEKILYSNVK